MAATTRLPESPLKIDGEAWKLDFREDDDDYYAQPRALFQLMSDAEKQRLFENTARAIGGASEIVRSRHITTTAKRIVPTARG